MHFFSRFAAGCYFRLFYAQWIVICLLGITGCQTVPAPGNYHGTLTLHQVSAITDRTREPVQVEVSYEGARTGKAVVKDFKTGARIMKPILLAKLSKKSLLLTIPDLRVQSYKLKRTKNSVENCYHADELFHLELCIDPENFRLELSEKNQTKLRLYGTFFDPRRKIVYEAPASFQVKDAIALAFKKNADVLEERESLIQAKAAAQSAYLRLLPQISAGTILQSISLEPMDLLQTIGNTAPFLFPNRWLEARKLKWQYHAARMSDLLLRANLATSIQTLSIGYLAKKNLKKELQELHAEIGSLLPLVAIWEAEKKVPEHSTRTMRIIHTDLEAGLVEAIDELQHDSSALAKAIGLSNPEAVQNMVLGDETTPIEDIPILPNEVEVDRSQRYYADLAISNSFEIRQQNYLKRAAAVAEKGIWINWFDPNVEPSGFLGFHLLAESKIARSASRLVQYKIERIEKGLTSDAFHIVHDLNLLRKFHSVAERSLVDRRNALWEVLSELQTPEFVLQPSRFSAEEIKGLLDDYVTGLKSLNSTSAAVLINQALLDRISLRGAYEMLLPQLKEILDLEHQPHVLESQ